MGTDDVIIQDMTAMENASSSAPLLERHSLELSSNEFTLLAGELVSAGCSLRFVAHGSSMQPYIQDGDEVLVVPVGFREIRLGDVILARRTQGGAVAHRVIKKHVQGEQPAVTLQGDNASTPDGVIPVEAVIGRVSETCRGGKIIRAGSARAKLYGWLNVFVLRLLRERPPMPDWLIRMLKPYPGREEER